MSNLVAARYFLDIHRISNIPTVISQTYIGGTCAIWDVCTRPGNWKKYYLRITDRKISKLLEKQAIVSTHLPMQRFVQRTPGWYRFRQVMVVKRVFFWEVTGIRKSRSIRSIIVRRMICSCNHHRAAKSSSHADRSRRGHSSFDVGKASRVPTLLQL